VRLPRRRPQDRDDRERLGELQQACRPPSGTIFLDDFYGDATLAERFGCNELLGSLRHDPAWDVSVLPETDTFEAIGSVQIARVAPA
jgi:hypothetical protein